MEKNSNKNPLCSPSLTEAKKMVGKLLEDQKENERKLEAKLQEEREMIAQKNREILEISKAQATKFCKDLIFRDKK